MDALPVDSPDNLSDTTVNRLKQRIRAEIAAGKMKPGVRMKLAEIAQRFNVSHMPVREALGQLSAEGLIILHPNKGASVRPVDRQFIDDIYDVRGALEGLLARRCAEKATPVQAAALRALAEAYAEAAARGDLPAMVQANRQFHRQITLFAENAHALRLLDHGWELIFGFRLRHGPTATRLKQIMQEHASLVAAIDAHDGAAAEEIARQHSVHAREDVLKLLPD
ncbi:GntR family transcriptional regulator [Pollutimonas bauzanensis]|uniref:DNA-binding transcriptional regulator, GntR family n=1 Tax=Pollutimonas bauzanensis TaxID=658167 RepID=A0A1M5QBK2_9BURK|nr:GntR family transcriptional regulator [Pollutimonas bauzanensis]SHH11300.1 DNA-binding transcriptional regulator, GntR family [Pollutimonas bauzanensis]